MDEFVRDRPPILLRDRLAQTTSKTLHAGGTEAILHAQFVPPLRDIDLL